MGCCGNDEANRNTSQDISIYCTSEEATLYITLNTSRVDGTEKLLLKFRRWRCDKTFAVTGQMTSLLCKIAKSLSVLPVWIVLPNLWRIQENTFFSDILSAWSTLMLLKNKAVLKVVLGMEWNRIEIDWNGIFGLYVELSQVRKQTK